MATAASQIGILRLSAGGRIASDNWEKVAVFLIVGYLCATRSFAYLGLPWISLYVGEMTLAAFLLFGPKTKQGPWLRVARHAPAAAAFRTVAPAAALLWSFRSAARNFVGLSGLHGRSRYRLQLLSSLPLSWDLGWPTR